MGLLTDAASVLLALTALASAGGMASRFRAVRWLWAQLVARPMSRWFKGQVTEAVEARLEPIRVELQANGGESLTDAVRRIESKVDACDTRLANIEQQVS